MEVSGKIIDILPAQSGKSAKGEWQKQDFILETEDKFPKKVCISVWNKKFDVDSMKGKSVKVDVNLESREFNGRWYTDVKAWRIIEPTADNFSQSNAHEDMPPPPPPPSADDELSSPEGDMPWNESNEDLPF